MFHVLYFHTLILSLLGSKSVAILKCLLSGGANPNVFDNEHRTPLHEAVDNNLDDANVCINITLLFEISIKHNCALIKHIICKHG